MYYVYIIFLLHKIHTYFSTFVHFLNFFFYFLIKNLIIIGGAGVFVLPGSEGNGVGTNHNTIKKKIFLYIIWVRFRAAKKRRQPQKKKVPEIFLGGECDHAIEDRILHRLSE